MYVCVCLCVCVCVCVRACVRVCVRLRPPARAWLATPPLHLSAHKIIDRKPYLCTLGSITPSTPPFPCFDFPLHAHTRPLTQISQVNRRVFRRLDIHMYSLSLSLSLSLRNYKLYARAHTHTLQGSGGVFRRHFTAAGNDAIYSRTRQVPSGLFYYWYRSLLLLL